MEKRTSVELHEAASQRRCVCVCVCGLTDTFSGSLAAMFITAKSAHMVKRAGNADFPYVEGLFLKARRSASDARLTELKQEVMQAYLQSVPKEGAIEAMVAGCFLRYWGGHHGCQGTASYAAGHSSLRYHAWLPRDQRAELPTLLRWPPCMAATRQLLTRLCFRAS